MNDQADACFYQNFRNILHISHQKGNDRIYHISTQESKQHYLNNHTVGSVIFFGTFLFIYHMITLYHSPFGMSMKACSPSLTLIISCVT